MTEEYIELLWKRLSSASGIENLDYGAAVTIGSVFGDMRAEIERLNGYVDQYMSKPIETYKCLECGHEWGTDYASFEKPECPKSEEHWDIEETTDRK